MIGMYVYFAVAMLSIVAIPGGLIAIAFLEAKDNSRKERS